MNNSNQLKEFSYFLRVSRNNIIERWLGSDEVKEIFLRHGVNAPNDGNTVFYDFFDCFISVMQWDLTISECPAKVKFLSLLKEHHITIAELFNLMLALKKTVLDELYKREFLSYGLLKDMESVVVKISNELSVSYEHLIEEHANFQDENANLLNEYKKAVDLSNIVSKTNTKGIITYVNDKFCEISGYARHELLGKPHNIIRHPSMPSSAFKDLWDTIKSKKPWHGLVTNMKKDGRKYVVDSVVIPILDIDGDIVEYIAIRHDVTEFEETKEQLSTLNKAMKHKVDELYNMTATLEEEASIDGLTGAFNRMKFEKNFEFEVNKAKLSGKSLSMILLDIDHFKSINDKHGHSVGDDVLKEIVELVSQNIRGMDTLARWGGEEFVVLLPTMELQGAVDLANRLKDLIQNSDFSTKEKITSSFGVGQIVPNESKNDFFERVDKALYEAKIGGRNQVVQAKE
jgi:diguanylate cyclase (GGDEF)-like protein/PAS domain S-box-containing protein